MDQQILITPQDVVNTILAICGAIITISAALTIILKAIQKMREPDKKQNERISALEEHVDRIEERLTLGNRRFETDTARVDELESAMKESNKVIIKGLLATTDHLINGDNIAGLKEARKELSDYLVTRS